MIKKLSIAITILTVVYYNKTRKALFKVPTFIKVQTFIKKSVEHMNVFHNDVRVINVYINDLIYLKPYFKFNVLGNKDDIIEILYSDNNGKIYNISKKARNNTISKNKILINKNINHYKLTNALLDSIENAEKGKFKVDISKSIINNKTIPITVDASMINDVEFISLLVNKKLVALFNFLEGSLGYVYTMLNIYQTSNVTILVIMKDKSITKITKHVEVKPL